MADLSQKQVASLRKSIKESTNSVVTEFDKVFETKLAEKVATLGDGMTLTDAQKQKIRKSLLWDMAKTIAPPPARPARASRKRARKQN